MIEDPVRCSAPTTDQNIGLDLTGSTLPLPKPRQGKQLYSQPCPHGTEGGSTGAHEDHHILFHFDVESPQVQAWFAATGLSHRVCEEKEEENPAELPTSMEMPLPLLRQKGQLKQKMGRVTGSHRRGLEPGADLVNHEAGSNLVDGEAGSQLEVQCSFWELAGDDSWSARLCQLPFGRPQHVQSVQCTPADIRFLIVKN
ncbi:hypothetical protein H920_18875 [Fukomys damarensis]|uniref:Uncharacterized protein n=1 Tax=Fukomys damarensis TaxID=885580 RepID=A0A091CNY2_FUKDA|nr:hypothetical protein H920_18875 [Fukomys damarensis]